MVGSDTKKAELKGKIRHGLVEYGINVIYLTLVFAAFTEYRRLILASHDIVYTDYGIAFIEAFILGKVIMIGAVFRLGRGLEAKPLIYPTIYKAVVFSVFVGRCLQDHRTCDQGLMERRSSYRRAHWALWEWIFGNTCK